MQAIAGRISAQNRALTNVSLDNVARDWQQAARWWRLAAEQGHGDAQSSLAGLYWHGRGVRENYVEAAKWYTKAAEQGDPCAQLQLGEMYRDSQGVRKDYVQAHMWMNLAATDELQFGGCVDPASAERQKLASLMSPAQVAEAQRRAHEWKSKISPDPVRQRSYKK